MTVKQMENRVKKLQALETRKSGLDDQISSLKAEIQAEMQEAETMETEHYIIRWTRVMSERFDTKTFKTRHAELFRDYVKTVESRRFTFAGK